MNDNHIPVPVAHKDHVELCAVQKTDETITLYEQGNPNTKITTDTLVEVKQ